MADELKPCPFCGGHPSLFPNDDDTGSWIGCDDCDAEISRSQAENAVAAWNTRTPTPAPQDAPETIWAYAEDTASITAWWQQRSTRAEKNSGDWQEVGQYILKATSDARIAELEAALVVCEVATRTYGAKPEFYRKANSVARDAIRALKKEPTNDT